MATPEKKATIILASGEVKALDHRPTLKEAQEIVGGYIELVKVKGATLVVDEDGKMKNRPLNEVITKIYGPEIYGRIIVGDVILLRGWKTVG